MKSPKYVIVVLVIIALVAILVAALYATSYFREKNTIARSSSARPSITLDNLSCDITQDAQTYSVSVRTLNANINTKQEQISDTLRALGGTIISTNQVKVYDRDAGYINAATINAVLPLPQTDTFISRLKSSVSSPDYLEDESNSTQDSTNLKQTCQSHLENLKIARSTEELYLSQLSADQAELSPLSPISDKSSAITKNLAELKQNAYPYRYSIETMMSQLNKTGVVINIKEIPG